MTLAEAQSEPMLDVHARLIRDLEQTAGLKRELEALPDDEALAERRSNHQGLVAPELAVVMAYCKIHLYAQLLETDLPEDPYLAHDLERYFPPPLPERFTQQMRRHRLRREIISTVVANQLVDRAGSTFAFRLQEETGAQVSIIARGYAVAREVFAMRDFWDAVEALDNQVDAYTQTAMLIEARRLVERATRWLVRSTPNSINVARRSRYFADGARMLGEALPDILGDAERENFDAHAAELTEAGVPGELARRVAGFPSLVYTFDVVEVSDSTGHDLNVVMETYFRARRPARADVAAGPDPRPSA